MKPTTPWALLLICHLSWGPEAGKRLDICTAQGQYRCGQGIPPRAGHVFKQDFRFWMLNCLFRSSTAGWSRGKAMARCGWPWVGASRFSLFPWIGDKENKIAGNVPISDNFSLFSENGGEKQHPTDTWIFPNIDPVVNFLLLFFTENRKEGMKIWKNKSERWKHPNFFASVIPLVSFSCHV